jgi:type IV secretory pathway VirB4 component
MKSLIAAAQKYKPYTSITDFAGTYKLLTEQCGGYYRRIEIGSDAARMNPLAWPDSKEQRDFATALISLLIEQRGQRLDADQIEDIHQGVVRFYESEEPKRLGAVVRFLPEEFHRPMRRWVDPGQYSWLLDNEETEENQNDFQTREFVGFDDEDHKELLEPLFMAKFHMDTMRIRDPKRIGQLKFLPNDEAWVMAKSPRGMDYLRGGLKRARMYNAVFMLATQAPRDASASPLWPVINQCCDKIMLADPEMTEAEYAADFGLRPKQIEMVRGLIPKKQLFIRNAGSYGKVVDLVLTERERLLYATDSPTLKLRQEAEEKYGQNFMEHLLSGNGNGNGHGANRESGNGANHQNGQFDYCDHLR